MDEPKPWLVLARAPGLHAGRLPPPTDPLALAGESKTALEKLGCSRDDIVAVLEPGGYDVDDTGKLQRRRRRPTTPRSRPARPA